MTSPDSKYADRIKQWFPCPVCEWLEKVRRFLFSLGSDRITRWIINGALACPLCTAGRPDVWVAGRELLRKRNAYIRGFMDRNDEIILTVHHHIIHSDRAYSHKDYVGKGPTDIDALLDVIEQVEKSCATE